MSPSGTRLPENIYIGSKPILNYVTALATAFQKDPIVNLLARRRAISSAVDVVEFCRRSFVTDISVDEILIGTEKMGADDDLRNVSTIQIVLIKTT